MNDPLCRTQDAPALKAPSDSECVLERAVFLRYPWRNIRRLTQRVGGYESIMSALSCLSLFLYCVTSPPVPPQSSAPRQCYSQPCSWRGWCVRLGGMLLSRCSESDFVPFARLTPRGISAASETKLTWIDEEMKQRRVRRACFHWKGDFTLAERRSTRSPPRSLCSYPSAFSFSLFSNRLNSFMSVYLKVFEFNKAPPPSSCMSRKHMSLKT